MNTTTTINFACAETVLPEKRHLTARSGMSALWWAMRQGILAARESRNTLPWLAPEKARELFDRWLRGEYAQIQWAWELMEKYDETLFAVKRARLAALQDMPWQIIIDADAAAADAARQQLAEAQKQYLNTLLGNVENLRAALRHLGAADFRGYAALEVCGTDERMRWETIEPWLLVRPSLAAPLMYNEKAEDSPSHPELLDSERVLLREAEPIDLPAMFLLTAKHHGTKAWDAFLDVFGIPSVFLETPPNTTEEQALEYQQKVEEIVGEGRGTIPNGAKFHTVETAQKETKSFQERADWCKNALLILATGGLLTVTAESGSGTLAGNAHADSFERLCAASAQDISEVVDFQFCRRKLMERFPGQPILAHFELAPQKEDDRAAQAQILATLAGAGFKPSAETVSEMMGFEVAAVEQQQEVGSRMFEVGSINNGGFAAPIMNSTASGGEPNSALQTSNLKLPTSSEALSEAELAALNALASGGLTAEGLQGTSRAIADALQGAISNACVSACHGVASEQSETQSRDPSPQIQNPTSYIQNSEACRAKDPDHCREHGEPESDDLEPWEKRQEEREHLEELLEELNWQEDAARDAEAADNPAFYDEDTARDRWSALSREGDPQTREDIEKRLAELDAEDAAEDDVVENKRSIEREYKRDDVGKFAETDSLGDGSKTQEKGKEEDEYNDKPTTFWSDWAPMEQLKKMDENEAREKIRKGISITDPTGHKVVLDQNLLNHWDATGDSEAARKERKDRLEMLPYLMKMLESPAEIWEDRDGTRKYFASYLVQEGSEPGKKWCIAFTLSRDIDNTKINTFYHAVRNPGNKRSGKILYPQKKEPAKTH